MAISLADVFTVNPIRTPCWPYDWRGKVVSVAAPVAPPAVRSTVWNDDPASLSIDRANVAPDVSNTSASPQTLDDACPTRYPSLDHRSFVWNDFWKPCEKVSKSR